ncbi:unnamed protein product [Heligmosomoides polygyrus]|uniref:PH domain-containing protein n=1 Tax=Heligmosomoides polygyrus TaxID=6339 RepID=A0A183F6Y8_HELPZ|nr:unnamed protein product [Heligmosomoides polygyrus]
MDMDPRLMSNDLGYVYKYMKTKNQTASGFENNLEMTLHALHQQADVAARLRSDWQHLQRYEAFLLEPPGEQVLLLNRCLRTGVLTLENMITRTPKSGKRFFKATYYPEQEGRQLLQILRNDMNKDDQCSQNEIIQLRNKLKDQELELKRMQDTINSLKEQSRIEVTGDLSKKTDRTAIVESPIPDLVSDDEYFDRMLDGVQGNNIGSESKGNIINKSFFLWYNWHLFLQRKGNRKNKLLLISYDTYSLQQTIRMSIKHLATIVLEYKCDIPNNIVRTIATSPGYTLTEAIIICKPRQKLYGKSYTSSHIGPSEILIW